MFGLTVGDLYDRCVLYYRDRTAIRMGERTCTYGQMQDRALRLAAALHDLGVKKGETAAFLMANCPEYVFCEYALARIGAVRVPLAVLLNPADHVYMLNRARCTTLIYHERLASRLPLMTPELETVKTFICISDDPARVPEGHLHLQTLIDEHEPFTGRVDVAPADLCGIYFTGGTTGRPKGVMLSHRAWAGTFLTELLEFGLGYDEVFCFATPLTHAGGCLMIPVMIRGGTCLIMDHFDPTEFLVQTERYGITSAFLVPTMLYLLLDHPERDRYDTSSWRDIIYGAAAIAPERLRQAVERFGPVFTQLYGQTEAPMAMCCLPREAHVIDDETRRLEVYSSCGRPCFPAQVRLVDGAGDDVLNGEVGEIVVRHINMMDGYLEDPEQTAVTIRGGWLHTGDLARMDEEGFLYIVDRCKDMIISGGFNIYPREIEDVLHEHPAVKNAAVVGIPHEKWGEEVKAVVVLYDDVTLPQQELISFVKERKGSLVAPKSVEFWTEIPLTNLGKVDKKRIRANFWKDRERMV